MRMRLLRLATVALIIPTLTACQTKLQTSSSEAVAEIGETRDDVKAELCRGQAPQQIAEAQYNSWPQEARDYAVNNTNQWLAAGCTL